MGVSSPVQCVLNFLPFWQVIFSNATSILITSHGIAFLLLTFMLVTFPPMFLIGAMYAHSELISIVIQATENLRTCVRIVSSYLWSELYLELHQMYSCGYYHSYSLLY